MGFYSKAFLGDIGYALKRSSFFLPNKLSMNVLPLHHEIDKLQSLSIHQIAIQSGFVQRRPRKIDPHVFMVSFLLMILNGGCSFSSFALTLGLLKGQYVSKQAINKKIKESLLRFLEGVLAKALTQRLQLHNQPKNHLLSTFLKQVLIHDSTCIQLNSAVAKHFPGNRNATTKEKAIAKSKLSLTFSVEGSTISASHHLRSTIRRLHQRCSTVYSPVI